MLFWMVKSCVAIRLRLANTNCCKGGRFNIEPLIMIDPLGEVPCALRVRLLFPVQVIGLETVMVPIPPAAGAVASAVLIVTLQVAKAVPRAAVSIVAVVASGKV